MKQFFQSVKKIFIREIRLISRDKNIISVILIAPLFYSFFYGSIYFNKVETNVEISIMDQDRSTTSSKIIRYLDANQTISINNIILNLEEGRSNLIDESAKAILYFPKGFEETLKKGKQADLKIYLNSTRFLVSNDINKAVNEVIGFVNAGITLKYFETKGNNFDQAKELAIPINMDIRPLFNFTESYGDFLIPAVLILILQQTLLIGLSQSIAREREKNTFVTLCKLGMWKPYNIIIGKGLFYLLLFASYSVFFFIVSFGVFKLPNYGNILPLLIITFLLLVSVIYFSVFIASFFQRKIVSLQFLTLTSYPIFLISGYSWPYNSLPIFLKALTNSIPSTPYFSAFTRITQMGANVADIFPEIIHLLILAIVGNILAYYRIKHLINKSIGTELSPQIINNQQSIMR